MTERVERLPCPVCLGVTMEQVAVGRIRKVRLDHCARCGGVWFDAGEIARVRRHRENDFWKRVPKRDDVAVAQCHACHTPFARDLDTCTSCGARTRFACPACDRPMKARRHGDLTLDVCKQCKGLWLDHHELAAIWSVERSNAIARAGGKTPQRRSGASDVDDLLFVPDLFILGAYTADAGVHIAGEALSSVPGMLAPAAEATGDLLGSVFEAIAEIAGSIFS